MQVSLDGDFGNTYADAWSSERPEAVADMFAQDGSLSINDGEPACGRAAICEVANEFMTAFPDMNITCDRFVLEDGVYQWYWTMKGTNTGPGGSGRPILISGFEELEFDSAGLIQTARGHFDQDDWDRQLTPMVAGRDRKV